MIHFRSDSTTNLFLVLLDKKAIMRSASHMYIADSSNNRIVKWTTNYTAGGICVAGCTQVAGVGANQFNGIRDLKFDSHGNLYASDQSNNRIQKFMIQLPTSACPVGEYSYFDSMAMTILISF
jgi:hypothetical protein